MTTQESAVKENLGKEIKRIKKARDKAVKANSQKAKEFTTSLLAIFDKANKVGQPLSYVGVRLENSFIIDVKINYIDDDDYFSVTELADFDQAIIANMREVLGIKFSPGELYSLKEELDSYEYLKCSVYEDENGFQFGLRIL